VRRILQAGARYVLKEPGSGAGALGHPALSDERPSGDGKLVLKLSWRTAKLRLV